MSSAARDNHPPHAQTPLVSRRVLLGFMAVVIFTTAELTWWVVFHMRYSSDQIQITADHMEHDRAQAEALIAAWTKLPANDLGSSPQDVLSRYFPHMIWRAGVHQDNKVIVPGFAGYGVAIRPGPVESLIERHRRSKRMFTYEGGVFVLALSLGVILILRILRHEVGLSRQQANFLSAVTHELKSPLASIRLFAETMQMRELTPEKRSRYLQNMSSDVDRLEGLVGNLLAVARLDAGRFAMHVENGDLVRDVSDIVGAARRELEARGANIQVDISADELVARYDLGVLQTIVKNLLDNAVKYGGDHKRVVVRIAASGRHAVIEVVDWGIGLPAAELSKIFRKFYRVGDEMVRQTEGSGLGLYLVRELARQSGGDVTATSDGPGKGSTFRVTLPLERRFDSTEAP